MDEKYVLVFLADGFEETEAIAVIDILRRGSVDVRVVSLTEDFLVKGAHGIFVAAEMVIENAEIDNAYALILPGGMPGTINLKSNELLASKVKEFVEAGKLVGAICAAPSILGEMGFLNKRKAVCYPGFEASLHGAEIPNDKTTVVDGNIITSVGVKSVIEFGLTLLEVIAGSEERRNVESQLKY